MLMRVCCVSICHHLSRAPAIVSSSYLLKNIWFRSVSSQCPHQTPISTNKRHKDAYIEARRDFERAKCASELSVSLFENLITKTLLALKPSSCFYSLARAMSTENNSDSAIEEVEIHISDQSTTKTQPRRLSPQQLRNALKPTTYNSNSLPLFLPLLHDGLTLCMHSRVVPDVHFFNAFLRLADAQCDAQAALQVHETMLAAATSSNTRLQNAEPNAVSYRILFNTLITCHLGSTARNIYLRYIKENDHSTILAISQQLVKVALLTNDIGLLDDVDSAVSKVMSCIDVQEVDTIYAVLAEAYCQFAQLDKARAVLASSHHLYPDGTLSLSYAKLRLHLISNNVVAAINYLRAPTTRVNSDMFQLLICHLFPQEQFTESAFAMIYRLVQVGDRLRPDTLVALFNAVFRHNHYWFPLRRFWCHCHRLRNLQITSHLFRTLFCGVLTHSSEHPDRKNSKSSGIILDERTDGTSDARFVLRLIRAVASQKINIDLVTLHYCVAAFVSRFPQNSFNYLNARIDAFHPAIRAVRRRLEDLLLNALECQVPVDPKQRLFAFPPLVTLLSYYSVKGDRTSFLRIFHAALPHLIISESTADLSVNQHSYIVDDQSISTISQISQELSVKTKESQEPYQPTHFGSYQESMKKLVCALQELPPEDAYAVCERMLHQFHDADCSPPYCLLRELMYLSPKQRPQNGYIYYQQAIKIYPYDIREQDFINTIRSLSAVGELLLIAQIVEQWHVQSASRSRKQNVITSVASSAELAVMTSVYAANLDLDTALDKLKYMRALGQQVPIWLYTSVLLGLVRQVRMREAEKLWYQATVLDNHQPDTYITNVLLDAYRRQSLHERFRSIVDQMSLSLSSSSAFVTSSLLSLPLVKGTAQNTFYMAIVDKATVSLVISSGIMRCREVAPRNLLSDKHIVWVAHFFHTVASDNRLLRNCTSGNSKYLNDCNDPTVTPRYDVDLQRYHFHLYLQFIQHTRRWREVQWVFEIMDSDQRELNSFKTSSCYKRTPVRERVTTIPIAPVKVSKVTSSNETYNIAEKMLNQRLREVDEESNEAREIHNAQVWISHWRQSDTRSFINCYY